MKDAQQHLLGLYHCSAHLSPHNCLHSARWVTLLMLLQKRPAQTQEFWVMCPSLFGTGCNTNKQRGVFGGVGGGSSRNRVLPEAFHASPQLLCRVHFGQEQAVLMGSRQRTVFTPGCSFWCSWLYQTWCLPSGCTDILCWSCFLDALVMCQGAYSEASQAGKR